MPGSQICPTIGLVFRQNVMGAGWKAPWGIGGGLRWGAHTCGAQVSGQILLCDQGLFHGTVQLQHATILVNEELGEIPFEGIS